MSIFNQEVLGTYEVQLMFEETSHEDLVAKDRELPSDVYLVRYQYEGEPRTSAFRAYKSVDIFDALFDLGCQVQEIRLGYGRIKPKLYGG